LWKRRPQTPFPPPPPRQLASLQPPSALTPQTLVDICADLDSVVCGTCWHLFSSRTIVGAFARPVQPLPPRRPCRRLCRPFVVPPFAPPPPDVPSRPGLPTSPPSPREPLSARPPPREASGAVGQAPPLCSAPPLRRAPPRRGSTPVAAPAPPSPRASQTVSEDSFIVHSCLGPGEAA